MLVNQNTKERWVTIPVKGLKGLYEISNQGRVKTTPYSRFEGKGLVECESVCIRSEQNLVHLNKAQYFGWYSVPNLYYSAFGEKMSAQQRY
tara:strand:+ start:9180 stop:9452 length:273 start_codon:yes stop_codon:yes gene_type:complete